MAADHDQIFGHGRWRRGVVTARCKATDVVAQIDGTVVTELFAHFTGVGVQRDQTGVGSRQEQATRARVAGGRRGCFSRWFGSALLGGGVGIGRFVVIAHATAGHVGPTFEVFSVLRADLRVVTPDFLAGVRIKGNHLAVRGAHIQHAVDFQRGVLGRGFARIAFARDVTGTECPRWYQLVGVFRGDFFQRRVAVAMGSTPVGLPVTVRHGRCGVGHAWNGIAVQFAFDFAGAGELAGQCSQTCQYHGDAQCARRDRRRLAARQRTTEPRQ